MRTPPGQVHKKKSKPRRFPPEQTPAAGATGGWDGFLPRKSAMPRLINTTHDDGCGLIPQKKPKGNSRSALIANVLQVFSKKTWKNCIQRKGEGGLRKRTKENPLLLFGRPNSKRREQREKIKDIFRCERILPIRSQKYLPKRFSSSQQRKELHVSVQALSFAEKAKEGAEGETRRATSGLEQRVLGAKRVVKAGVTEEKSLGGSEPPDDLSKKEI